MKRILCAILVLSMLAPLAPARAQLLSSPIDLPIAGEASLSEMLSGPVLEDYVLGVGDQLEAHLIVGDNALVLDYTFIVNPEGKIFFPNIAEVSLAGVTLKQARLKLEEKIKQKYDEKFDLFLTVSVPKKINVYVTGQVDTPGLLTVYDGTRISEVLKKSGVAKGGSTLVENIYLRRKKDSGDFEEYKLSLYDIFSQNDGKGNMALKNGDIIAVPAIKSYVYVYGDVARSGTYGYVPGQSLSDYLNVAGGPTARANLSGVTVTRLENGKPKVYHIDVSEILQRGVRKNDIDIFAGDVINVPGNFFYFTDFASFANTVLLALTLYSSVIRYR